MKVLLIGFGSIGSRHAKVAIENFPHLDFSILRSSKSHQEMTDNGSVYFDIKNIPRDKKFDLILICSPTSVHLSSLNSVEKFLKKDTGVFFEKPYSNTIEDIEEIQRIVEKNEVKPFYGCLLRHHPLLLEAVNWINDGDFGVINRYEIECLSYLPDWRPNTDYRESYSAKRNMGGGVLLDLIHEFDYAELLFGEIASLSGQVGKFSDLEIDSDDFAEVQCVHKNAHGKIKLSYASKALSRKFYIESDTKIVIGDFLNNRLTLKSIDNNCLDEKSWKLARDDLFLSQWKKIMTGLSQKNFSMDYFYESTELNKKLIQFRNDSA
ncbi:MAG: Gfo/Idh/MocA family oxidoreductase [Oligoflexia bacterium]|nr:Gfo/Idh/MocA family oxidoreductase [Oligoflexia bacterium]